jgi:DNA-3-methyladenine glycosylase I
LKIASAITNAGLVLEVQKEFGSLDEYLWQFVGRKQLRHACQRLAEIPISIPEAETMSRDLKKRGFKFVGPTICYSFMQAVGMVNDHVVDCFRYRKKR